jgi:lipopolysaccharide transport system permease protein
LHYLLVLGFALLFSCGNVLFRDIGYMVGVAIVFGFYASPVFYRLDFVMNPAHMPEWIAPYYPALMKLYLANPMAELITAYRQILFEHRFPDLWLLAWPAALSVIALVAGAFVFRRIGPTLSDHL